MAKKGEIKNRVGEIHITNEGYKIEIIEYFNSKNITIQFEDGVTKENILYGTIVRGEILKPIDRIGETYITNEGYKVVIIENFGRDIWVIQFNDKNNTILENIRYIELNNGQIKNPNHLSVHGIGYIGQGIYKSSFDNTITKSYSIWQGIITRCYSEKFQEKYPTYIGCSVGDHWHNFQNFAAWFEENYNPEVMQGWHLDKDILVRDNKVYSSETCCFVPREINNIFKNKHTGRLPKGVTQVGDKFQVMCHGEYKGLFNIEDEAFQTYKTTKEPWIKKIADEWKPLIKSEVYRAMYNYEV
jgi:hypothetical protein